MKRYDPVNMRESGILQLLILHCLYSEKESRDVFFQGGTAIRWCYNGGRFSEDLDFTTHLDIKSVERLIEKVVPQVRKGMVAHFGPGSLDVQWKSRRRKTYHVVNFQFLPEGRRRKVYVRVEFEELEERVTPDTERFVLSMLPQVRQLVSEGVFRIPRTSSIIVAETREEILSDKIRALLERGYLKGRDFYDLWFLNSLKVRCRPSVMKRKLRMYRSGFRAKRTVVFFRNPDSKGKREIIDALRQDLSRFIPPEEFAYHEEKEFMEIFDALKEVFAAVEGVIQ